MAFRINRKKTARKKVPRRKKRDAAGKPTRPFTGLFWSLLLRVSVALALCFAGFMVYLDRQIQKRFEQGLHPQPAHIYSRSERIAPDLGTDQEVLEKTLRYHGYRSRKKVDGPGSFVVAGNRMDLFFNKVGDRPDQPPLVRLEFRNRKLSNILDHANGQPLDAVYLEPSFIGSLQLGPYQDRIALKLHEMPELLIKALLSMEDRNFETHVGVDLVAIGRAVTNNVINRRAIQGGSTITQQLVKNVFLSPERSLSRKITEAMMAIVMEMRYSKAEILEYYLNEIFLGQAGNRAVHGFALASEYYFARPLSQLGLQETATLVGMIPAPSFYNPRRHPERARSRRNLVLNTLASTGEITAATARALGELPLTIAPLPASTNNRFPAYIDYLHRQIRQYFSEDVLRSDGLKLYTTLDQDIQKHAQVALSTGLVTLEENNGIDKGSLQGAIVVVDSQSGDILSMVGDRLAGYSGFNRAVDASRPIGSLIKPLVYLTALEQPRQFSLATIVDDSPLTLYPDGGEPWSPLNYDKTFRGTTNVLESLTRSYNVPTVRVGLDIGVQAVIDTINRLGVRRKIPPYPSVLLGASDHSPVEIAQLYQSIASHGIHSPLRSLSRITNRQGEEIARFPREQKRVIEEVPAYLIDYALKQVVRRGTAARLAQWFSPDLQLAGKTGTTDDYRDSWFAGYSGNLLAVVWVGRDDNKPIGLTGSSGAMRVWKDLMSGLDLTPNQFDPPDEIIFQELDPGTGLLAKGGCPERISLPVDRKFSIRRDAPCAGLLSRVQSWFNIDVAKPRGTPQIQDRSVDDRR